MKLEVWHLLAAVAVLVLLKRSSKQDPGGVFTAYPPPSDLGLPPFVSGWPQPQGGASGSW